jgi:ABC-type transporter Mla subunit MlaD
MGEADKALASLDQSLATVRNLMDKRGPELDQILVSLAATLKQAETFMGRFTDQDHPELAQSLRSLRRSLASVEELLELLKQKPHHVVWGTPSDAEREKAKKNVEAGKQTPPGP